MAETTVHSNKELETQRAEYTAQLQALRQALEEETAERKRLEQQIRDAAGPAHSEPILERLPVGVFLAEGEAHTRTVRWKLINKTGQDQIQASYIIPGVVSETFAIYRPDGTPFLEDDLPVQAALWQGREVVSQPMLFRFHAGGERILEATTHILRDEAGVREVVAVLLDVTDRDRARQNLDKERDDFIALVSHELRTPITTIKASSQLGVRNLRKAGGDERMTRLFTTINEQSDRMTRLIDDLLEASRLQGNTLSLQIEQVELRTLVERVLDNQEPTAPGFVITRTLPHDPVYAHVDQHRLEQVVANLLQNAIKYSGSSKQIEVDMEVRDGQAVFSIRDYGVGIPADEQTRVFERFFRARNADSQNSQGLGLGLSIAHGIVARLGGRMWLRSAEGKGSTFYFTLPVVREIKSVHNDQGESA